MLATIKAIHCIIPGLMKLSLQKGARMSVTLLPEPVLPLADRHKLTYLVLTYKTPVNNSINKSAEYDGRHARSIPVTQVSNKIKAKFQNKSESEL